MLMAVVLCTMLLIILLLVLFALFAAINIRFTYRGGKADMEVSMLGSLIRFRPRAETLLRLAAGGDKKDKHKKDEKNKDEDNSDSDKRKKTLDGINDIFALVGRVKRTYVKSRPFVRKRFVIKKLAVHIKYSMADAALTGITAGALWSLMYQTFGLLSTIASAPKPDFEVMPVYEERFSFDTEAECILKLRTANIIGILLCVMHNYRTAKQK